MNIDEQIRAVFDIIMEYTEKPEDDRALGEYIKVVRAMCGEDKQSILGVLTSALYRGLATGLWPWKGEISQ